MSCILYYSNYCQPSKKLLFQLSKSKIKDDIHFVCIDNRQAGPKKTTLINLPTGQQLVLPSQVTKVPALLLLHHGQRILFGSEIYRELDQKMRTLKTQATQNNQEPLAFSYSEMGHSLSDTYSYLDTSPADLAAKGAGGMRILHNYVTLDGSSPIATPPESYTPNKIGDIDIGKIQMQRNQEIQNTKR